MNELSAMLAAINRYPVKGFPGEALERVSLTAGEGLPGDRRFAITNAVSSTIGGAWMGCDSFYINATTDGMLRFSQSFDEKRGVLVLGSPEGQELEIDLRDPASLEAANRRMALFVFSLPQRMGAPAPMLAIRNQRAGELSGYWDFRDTGISLINAATVREIGRAANLRLDPRRFRGNLLVDGMEAWAEFALPGHRARLGEAELEFIRPAARCPATSVNPDSAERDAGIPDLMQNAFGHNYCGIYARVVKDGTIRRNDRLVVTGPATLSLGEAASNGAPDYRLWPKFAEVGVRETQGATTRLGLRAPEPWPLPEAGAGQRLRVHLGPERWTAAEVLSHEDGMTMIGIDPSQTGDPATEHLRTQVDEGARILVTGPFGRAS